MRISTMSSFLILLFIAYWLLHNTLSHDISSSQIASVYGIPWGSGIPWGGGIPWGAGIP